MQNELKNNIDFIVIGAQKAGTSWLYECLRHAPDFSLLPVKELHYFDRSREYPTPSHLSVSNGLIRSFNILRTGKAMLTIAKHLYRREIKTARWYFRYYFSGINDSWYISLFNGLYGITGEICPGYSVLKVKDIEKMYAIAPVAKIIFILRNPVHRAWSHYKFDFRKKCNRNHIDIQHIKRFMNSANQELRSDYLTTIENYSKVYPQDQIKIFFYDTIKDNPLIFLEELITFIGGQVCDITKWCDYKRKVNVSDKIEMPEEIRIFLKEKYKSQMIALSEKFGGYCNEWLKS